MWGGSRRGGAAEPLLLSGQWRSKCFLDVIKEDSNRFGAGAGAGGIDPADVGHTVVQADVTGIAYLVSETNDATGDAGFLASTQPCNLHVCGCASPANAPDYRIRVLQQFFGRSQVAEAGTGGVVECGVGVFLLQTFEEGGHDTGVGLRLVKVNSHTIKSR